MQETSTPLTWSTLQARWASHHVPLVEVLPPEESGVRWHRRAWVNRDGSSLPLLDPPMDMTALLLARGDATKSPELFAAFAISLFLRNEGQNAHNQEVTLLLEGSHLGRQLKDLLGCWHGNAVHVLPLFAGGPQTPVNQREWATAQHWTYWVDLAAERWKHLAMEFAVVVQTQHIKRPT